ncbi:hypothetical protein KSP39_PZI001174 [Platanthera zijinensis]|uniref:Integrase catalytic domain-containing protein n=1 Tax=Platanthera zijinensis TaxID=2320716 RepID=A0AAP0GG08_9ASPA
MEELTGGEAERFVDGKCAGRRDSAVGAEISAGLLRGGEALEIRRPSVAIREAPEISAGLLLRVSPLVRVSGGRKMRLTWKFEDISMDFVHGLPRSQRGNDSIWVIVDRLTKVAHFLSYKQDDSVEMLAKLYVEQIVRLHGVPWSIVSDRDGQFTSKDWRLIHQLLGTKLAFSMAFHPQTDGQTERTNRTMEDMLRICALDFGKKWEDHLVMKLASPNFWDKEVEDANSTIRSIRERLLIAHDRQAKYYNAKHRNVEFTVGDLVYLKIKPFKGISRIRRLKKLNPRYLVKDPAQVIENDRVPVEYGLTTKVRPIRIEDRDEKQLRNKMIGMVKVRWDNCGREELTWEREQTMRAEFPELFL